MYLRVYCTPSTLMMPVFIQSKIYLIDERGNEIFSAAGARSKTGWISPVNGSDSGPFIVICGNKKYIISKSKVEEFKKVRALGRYVNDFRTGFSCGFAVVSTQDGRFGAVSATGEWLIPPEYNSIEPFVNGLCLAEPVGGKNTLVTIDLSGTLLNVRDDVMLEVESTVDCCRDPLKYVAMAQVGGVWRSALIRGEKRKCIERSQYIVSAFSSAAVVHVGGEYSRIRRIVNIHGEFVGSHYAWVEHLGGDLFSAKRSWAGKTCEIVDAHRGVLFKCKDKYHPAWCNGFFEVKNETGAELLDANGRVVCYAKHGRISPHYGGFVWYDWFDLIGGVEPTSAAVLDYKFRCVWKVGPKSPELIL